MAAPVLADRLRAGECLITGWIGLPEPLIAELAARSAFDCVTVDMQHGLQDTASVMRSVSSIAFGGKPAIVRVAVGDFAMVSRALDMGAEAVIAPMVNSVAEAKALAAAAKYPPIGERSWGPARAMTVLDIKSMPEQLETANRSTLVFAMIETVPALEAIDDILAVEGIDGVFMGPSDLSVTLSNGKSIAPADPSLDAPIRRIAERAKAAGKLSGAFGVTGARVRYFREIGYNLIALGTDQIYLAAGIDKLLSDAKG